MAKGGIQAKGKKDPSKHSRAARRATSPGIDLDKSLKDVRPPPESINHRPAVLAAHSGAGVTKKSKKGRKSVLSSRARRRQEKGLGKAEAIIERTAQKVQRSKGQAKNTQSRKKTWDEINNQIPDTQSSNKFAGLDEEDDDLEDTDDEMDEQVQPSESIASAAVPVSGGKADEDDIL